MKTVCVLLFTIIALNSFSQGWRISGDSLIMANGAKFTIRDKVKLGYGSGQRKDFEFIYTSPMSFAGKQPLGSGYSGMTMIIKDFKEFKSKRLGNKVYLVLGGGNIVNYWCDIVAAIDQKEVIPQ